METLKLIGNYLIHEDGYYYNKIDLNNIIYVNDLFKTYENTRINFTKVSEHNTKYAFYMDISYKNIILLNLVIKLNKTENVYNGLNLQINKIIKLLSTIDMELVKGNPIHLHNIKELKMFSKFFSVFNLKEYTEFDSDYLKLDLSKVKGEIYYQIQNSNRFEVNLTLHVFKPNIDVFRMQYKLECYIKNLLNTDIHNYVHSVFKLILYFAHKQKATKFLDQLERFLICQQSAH